MLQFLGSGVAGRVGGGYVYRQSLNQSFDFKQEAQVPNPAKCCQDFHDLIQDLKRRRCLISREACQRQLFGMRAILFRTLTDAVAVQGVYP